jgi:hypothetical protein
MAATMTWPAWVPVGRLMVMLARELDDPLEAAATTATAALA